METRLDFRVERQPDDVTCGPTCLHAVYRFYGEDLPLDRVIAETQSLKEGGTLSVFLGSHALRQGYKATIYTYNLQIFDPTWFERTPVDIRERLLTQAKLKRNRKLRAATKGYVEFLDLGGKFRMQDLRPKLIREYLKKDIPILTGLSSTYLYRAIREFGPKNTDDDVRGEPQGHFVVLCGYDPTTREVLVADPLHPNPAFEIRHYTVPIERVITAILLGIVTYDANLLIIEKPPSLQ